MKLTDFSISEFNRTLQMGIKNQKLDFCNAVAISNKKISVTLKSVDRNKAGKECVALTSELETSDIDDFSQYYYGCSPKINSTLIIDAISNLRFIDNDSLVEFIKENASYFMIHKSQEKHLLGLAKLILITLASKYGITIRENDPLKEVKRKNSEAFASITSCGSNSEELNIHGCPTKALIKAFEGKCFKAVNGVWEISDSGVTFTDIYKNKKNIRLLVGKVFYSGVLIKPITFYESPQNYENADITNIVIEYERSTFATVCAIDDNSIEHPLLSESNEQIKEFIEIDNGYKREMYEKLNKPDIKDKDILAIINKYLENSFNVNQIGVSGNVVTSDDKIFFGLRGNGNIDDGLIYPGVNGNAEVYDEMVDFYNYSVYEDLPSVAINDVRSDLLGEISREAYGELRLNQRKEAWECYGIIISGTSPFVEKYESTARRCHFNVLFETEVDETFENIKERQTKASEAFENKSFVSFKTDIYKNKADFLLFSCWDFFKKVLDSKEFIESVLLLIITATSLRTLSLSLDNLSLALSVVFAILILITNIVQVNKHLLRWSKNKKTNKKINMFQSMTYDEINEIVLKKLGNNYHPVAYAALKLHLENKIYDNLKED